MAAKKSGSGSGGPERKAAGKKPMTKKTMTKKTTKKILAKTATKVSTKPAARPSLKAARPPAAKSVAAKSAVRKPAVVKLTVEKPTAAKPTAAKPAGKTAPTAAAVGHAADKKKKSLSAPVIAEKTGTDKSKAMAAKSGKLSQMVEAGAIAPVVDESADISPELETGDFAEPEFDPADLVVAEATALDPSAARRAAMSLKGSVEAEKVAQEKKKKKDELKIDRTGDLQAQWTSLKEKTKAVKPVPYKMTERYEARVPIQHKVLGWGYVLTNQNDRLEVLFEEGIKFLISNYKA